LEQKPGSPAELIATLARAVLPIVAIAGDGGWHAIGTCFVVAIPEPKKAFALTAVHNLEYAKKCIRRDRPHYHPTTLLAFRGPDPDAFNLSEREEIKAIAGGAQTPALATAARAWWTESSDIALMLLELPTDGNDVFDAVLRLDSRPVHEGLEVAAFGYSGLQTSSTQDYETERFTARVGYGLVSKPGTVVELHPSGLSIHKWPCFRVTCSLDSGMSGGPVTDGTLAVRGLVGGDMSTDPNDGSRGAGDHAIAGSIWPAMLIRTNVEIVDGKGNVQVAPDARLFEWVRQGVIQDRGEAHMHIRSALVAGSERFWWES